MKRNISSILTPFYKVIWPSLFTGIFLYLILIRQNLFEALLALLFLWLPGTAVYYFFMLPLKSIAYDEDSLYISNYLKEVKIPLSDIKEVKETVGPWTMPRHQVCLTLKPSTEFGKRVRFVPQFPIKETIKNLKREMSKKTR